MPALRTYKLFISHSWSYHEDYDHLKGLLEKAPNFIFYDYSVPFHDPIDSDKAKKVKEEIKEHIRQVSVFIVLAGMYANYSKWIEFEVGVAKDYKKPILGITPRGNERTPQYIQNVSARMVGWNTDNIISAIRDLAAD